MDDLKVLIVDDELVFCENMAKLLNKRGFQVDTANEGESAIGALQNDSYDVVVLDLKMPGMNGIDILRKMKEIDIAAQAIMLTGHGAVDSAMEAIHLGAYDYIPKPCEVEELSEMIVNAHHAKNNKKGKKRK